MKSKNNMLKASFIGYYLASFGFYMAGIIGLINREGYYVMYLCLGSAFLCLGSSQLNVMKKNAAENGEGNDTENDRESE